MTRSWYRMGRFIWRPNFSWGISTFRTVLPDVLNICSLTPLSCATGQRLHTEPSSVQNELKGLDLLEAINFVVKSNHGLLDGNKAYKSWKFLRDLGYQIDLYKDGSLLRECPERILWKTLCLRIERQPVTVESLLETLHLPDTTPVKFEGLRNKDTIGLQQHICELLAENGANPDYIKTQLPSQLRKETCYTIYLLLNFFNTTADMIAWQIQSVIQMDPNTLVREYSQIKKLGLEMPDHIVIYLCGFVPENNTCVITDPFEKSYSKLVNALVQTGEKWEPSKSQRKELNEVVRQHPSGILEILHTLHFLKLEGYKLMDVRACILVLSFKVRHIQNVLQTNPELRASLTSIKDPRIRLYTLFVIMDRQQKFKLIKSVTMKNFYYYQDRTYLL